MDQSEYGFSRSVSMPQSDAIAAVTAALAEEGFGVLTEIDVRRTLKEKIGAEIRDYVILGACNPHLADKAIGVELNVGLLLPCNVVVYESDGGSVVSMVDPMAMLGVAENPDLEPIALEAAAKLKRALVSVAAT